jgi:6-pyruvoyl tetrahydropterin synthase/QueD family protein
LKIYYTKEISSAHKLDLPYESKCINMHGHNYKVEVYIQGSVNKYGLVMDFNHIKEIVVNYDHITLNDKIKQPTVENLVTTILNDLNQLNDIDNISSITVRIWEDTESYAEETWTR